MTKIVDDSPLQFTYRQMHRQMSNPKFFAWMLAAIIILTVAGPFGTLQHYNFLERFAYWTIVTPITFSLANFCATYCTSTLIKRGVNDWLSYALSGIICALPVGSFVWIFGIILKQSTALSIENYLEMVVTTLFITLPITLLFRVIEQPKSPNQSTKPMASLIPQSAARQSETFFSKIPNHLGRDIIYLNAQDHYIEVKTTLGTELVLMRFGDAISELSEYDGVSPHRSWWVSKKHVAHIISRAGKKFIKTTEQQLIPISRSNLQKTYDCLGK